MCSATQATRGSGPRRFSKTKKPHSLFVVPHSRPCGPAPLMPISRRHKETHIKASLIHSIWAQENTSDIYIYSIRFIYLYIYIYPCAQILQTQQNSSSKWYELSEVSNAICFAQVSKANPPTLALLLSRARVRQSELPVPSRSRRQRGFAFPASKRCHRCQRSFPSRCKMRSAGGMCEQEEEEH